MDMSSAQVVGRVGNIFLPVPNVESASRFYQSAFGLRVKFADRDRFIALDGATTTVALVSPEEDVTAGRVAASFKVPNVELALQSVVAAGGTVVAPATTGPHEVRAVIADPGGNLCIVYAPLSTAQTHP